MDDRTPINVEDSIKAQAWYVSSRYRGHVDQDDLIQEGWIWVLEHPAQVKGFQEHEDAKLGQWLMNKRLADSMAAYARREKAHASGYEVDDELFFSDALISLVLPSVLKDDPTPPVQAGERVANTSDPAEGGVWMATYFDVKRAWETADLTGQQRDLLVDYHRDEYTQSQLADKLSITQQTVAKRLKKARAKLIDKLGGPKPQVEPAEVEHHPGAKTADQPALAVLR
jgi:RNA polymerase sigma factor (sigma-70 family)